MQDDIKNLPFERGIFYFNFIKMTAVQGVLKESYTPLQQVS